MYHMCQLGANSCLEWTKVHFDDNVKEKKLVFVQIIATEQKLFYKQLFKSGCWHGFIDDCITGSSQAVVCLMAKACDDPGWWLNC